MPIKRSSLFLALCSLLITSTQAQIQEQKALKFVKSLSASALDSTLPHARFSDWLAAIAGDSAVIVWELSDCGEQTGDSAIDNKREIPLCVGVYVTFPDHRELGIMILLGTHNKGIAGQPAVYDMYLASEEKILTIRRLSEIKNILKRTLR